MLRAKQQGFSLLEVMIVMAIVGIASLAWFTYQNDVQAPQSEAAAGASFVDSVSKSSMAFYLDNRRWPNNITELKNSQQYFGNTVSSYGTTPAFSVNNGLLAISLNAADKAGAVRLKQHLTNKGVSTTDVSNETLTLYLDEPTENSIQSYFLARREVPGCPNCNTLETDIDANGYDIKQVKRLSGDNAAFDRGDFNSATIDNLTSEAIRMAGVVLSGNGNRLNVNADEVNITGDINGQGGQFDRVQADTVRGNDFFGDDFVTDVTSTNQNKQELDQLKSQWDLCVREGNCK